METGQEGALLNSLSGENDHSLLSDLQRLEIQQLWVRSTMHACKQIHPHVISGKYGLERKVRSKQREICNIGKQTTTEKGLCVKSLLL